MPWLNIHIWNGGFGVGTSAHNVTGKDLCYRHVQFSIFVLIMVSQKHHGKMSVLNWHGRELILVVQG